MAYLDLGWDGQISERMSLVGIIFKFTIIILISKRACVRACVRASECACEPACERARVRACVRACVRASERASVRACVLSPSTF